MNSGMWRLCSAVAGIMVSLHSMIVLQRVRLVDQGATSGPQALVLGAALGILFTSLYFALEAQGRRWLKSTRLEEQRPSKTRQEAWEQGSWFFLSADDRDIAAIDQPREKVELEPW